MGAKPPKILENRDKFVLGNKSGNKGTSILRYFDLGWKRRFSRNSQNLSFQFYFGGEAPENFRKLWLALSQGTNLVIKERPFFVISFLDKVPRFLDIAGKQAAGCNFGPAKVYIFNSISGAKRMYLAMKERSLFVIFIIGIN